jgi:nitrogen fixation protein FixH
MKINWGTGILIALAVMIVGMITLVWVAVHQDYDLVENDYYQKSVNYQQQIDKEKKTDALAEKITFIQSGDTLKLTFPDMANFSAYSGRIHFYSPVAEKRDLTLPVKLNSVHSQIVDLKSLQKGRYVVKIDWSANKTDYYQEEEITLVSGQSQ